MNMEDETIDTGEKALVVLLSGCLLLLGVLLGMEVAEAEGLNVVCQENDCAVLPDRLAVLTQAGPLALGTYSRNSVTVMTNNKRRLRVDEQGFVGWLNVNTYEFDYTANCFPVIHLPVKVNGEFGTINVCME